MEQQQIKPEKPTTNDHPPAPQKQPEPFPNVPQESHSANRAEQFVDKVSIKYDEDTQSATSRLRRRGKCPEANSAERPQAPAPMPCKANQSLIAKTMQRERLTKALSVPKRSDGQKMKRIVFNGTFPIDDPYSSRFDNEEDEEEDGDYENYDDEHDSEYEYDVEDGDHGDEEEQDAEGGDVEDGGISIQELARDKRYYVQYNRIKNDYQSYNLNRFGANK